MRAVVPVKSGVAVVADSTWAALKGRAALAVEWDETKAVRFRDGAAVQQNYGDFEVARMRDAPVIETHIVPSDAGRPFGLGEPPVPPIAPAIANAICAATEKRVRKLPIHPADLRA